MLEERPDKWKIDIIDRAAYLRGRYMTSFAQCEFLLADLSVRVDNRFRYPLKKRINAALTMAESGGALNAYADEFVPMIESFIDRSHIRHWLAHGFLILITDKAGNHLLSYRRYLDDAQSLTTWECTLEFLEKEAASITIYAQNFVKLHKRIYLDLGLENAQ